jgi:predicted DNA-binding transcriptional regulator AlpA
MKKEPKTLKQFHTWLEAQFDELQFFCQYAEPDFFDQLGIAETVEVAHRHACRFGAGHVVPKEQTLLAPREGLAIIGQLLAWAKSQLRCSAELLSDSEVGEVLGVSARTVWRMLSTDELPSPIKIGGLTKWRRSEIEAMIDLREPAKR